MADVRRPRSSGVARGVPARAPRTSRCCSSRSSVTDASDGQTRPPARAQPQPGLGAGAGWPPRCRPATRGCRSPGTPPAGTPRPGCRTSSGSDYMVEHWLAAYALLYLDEAD